MSSTPFGRGEHVLVRHVFRGRVWYALPTTAVFDDGHRIGLYLRAGTPVAWTQRLEDIASDAWNYELRTWEHHNVLKLLEPGKAHAIWCMWAADDWAFRGWYVNLQDPLRRRAHGVDTWDHELDIVVAPDLSWSWKDEDEFAYGRSLGLVAPEEAAAIRSEGERVIDRIESRSAPFDEDWPSWRPDPEWTVPLLPDDWSAASES